MIERRLQRQLEEVARRIRRVRLWGSLATVWLLAALLGITILWANLRVQHAVPLLALSAAGVAAVCVWYALHSVRDYRSVARRIESRHPELNACLLAALEQTPELPGGRFGFLQDRVIGAALEHAYRHPWRRAVPAWQLLGVQLGSYASLLLLAGVLLSLLLYTRSASRLAAADARDSVLYTSGTFDLDVQPGNADVERGTSLLVLARFRGRLPAEAVLVYRMGEQSVELDMSKSLDDPVFGGRIPDIRQELDYQVQFAGQQSESFHVTVFDYPQLQRADVQLDYPDYTGLEPRLIQDVRQASAVQGTQLTLLCYLNKAVAEATLTGPAGVTIPLVAGDPAADPPEAADPGKAALYKATLDLQTTQRLRLELIDQQGRKNLDPPEFVFHALPNKPADLRIVQPARDVQVSPLEELQLTASIWDDFGLARYGLNYGVAGGVGAEIVLGEKRPGNERVEAASLIDFESLEAEPDQLLSYYFWAEDVGPDGNVRRTFSDMYFAEVRHFEEIFRQGQQPPGGAGQQQSPESPGGGGGQGQNASRAEELGDIQKEIINATWKLIRRETAATPTKSYAEDAALVRDSQTAALEMLEELAGNIQDAESLEHVEAVRDRMQQALSHLSEASRDNSVVPLQPALAAEQAAYQSLLKLRAREFEVVRANAQQQQSRSQSRGSSSRAQRQLQELELSNNENRYETERSAQDTQQSTAEREVRQVLNRLRELARRQNDLNKRLKELQSALEEARDEQQREELRRQLQRLQDEQQQILRDMDELNSRMNQPENREQMADSRQQLQQSRENVRQASDALQQGMVPQAIASGTRAERELNELREEFRRQASGQFDEQMREMREAARQLDQRQQDLSQRLGQLDDSAAPRSGSLRDVGERENIQEDFQEQQQNLKDLLDRMRETVEGAEATEPLLAEQLYDAVRDAQHQNVERALESARRSLERGLVNDSRSEERVAQGGISRLREGVERAAESLLGDETEALRRAQQELDRLSRQLNQEIARAQGRSDTPAADESQDREGQDSASPDRAGQQQDGQQQAGQQREGQQREGRQRDDQQQREGQAEEGQGESGQQGQGRQGQSQRDGQGEPGQQQPGESPAAQPGQQPGSGARRLSDGDPGQQQRDTPQGSGQRGADRQPGEQDGRRPGPGSSDGGQRSDDRLGGIGVFLNNGNRPFAPLTGEDYLNWSDRLRDVEEMIDDPELRAEAARIRDRARGFRVELKRHSTPPNWDLVLEQVARPLVELRDRIAEELQRRASRDALVPIDRDPVPPKYADQVRRYYERLGKGQ